MIPTRSMQDLQFFLKFDTRYEVLSRSVKTSSFVVPWIRRACRSLSLPLGSSLAKGKMGMGHGHFPLVSLVRAGERKRRKTKKQTNEPTNIHIPYQYVLNHWANSDPNLVWVIIVIVMSYSQFTSKSLEVRSCLWVSSYQVTSSSACNLSLIVSRGFWHIVLAQASRLFQTSTTTPYESSRHCRDTPLWDEWKKNNFATLFFFPPPPPKNKNKQTNVKQVFWPPRASLDLFGNP